MSGQDVQYDLIVYPLRHGNDAEPSGVNGQIAANTAQWRACRSTGDDPNSPRVYYRQALRNTSHTVARNLEPDVQYGWSIRARRGDQVDPWSTLDGNWRRPTQLHPLKTIGGIAISPMFLLGGAWVGSPEAISIGAQPYGKLLGTGSREHAFTHLPFSFVTPQE